MVELCEQRTNILLLDEEVILREAKNINIKKIRLVLQSKFSYLHNVVIWFDLNSTLLDSQIFVVEEENKIISLYS